MTRARHQMNNAIRKKMDKEVKKGEKNFTQTEALPDSNTLTTDQMLKKYPKKIEKSEKSLLASLKKNVEIKHAKAKSSHSKRTTPGTVEGQPGAPAFTKQEGAHWKKTLKLQNKVQSKALTHKLNKKK